MCIISALLEHFLKLVDHHHLLRLRQLEEAVRPDEFKNSRRVGYQEVVDWVRLKN